MSLKEKLLTFVARCGTPAKFVAKTVLGYALPGSNVLIDLVEKLIDCAQQTAKDNLEIDQLASKADLERIEKMFDEMLGDMKDVVEKLKHLESVPETAKKTLRAALAIEQHCLAAAQRLLEQGLQLSAVQAGLEKVSAGQEELLDLQRRFFRSHLDYIEEERQHHRRNDERLQKIEDLILAARHGDHDRAERISDQLCREQPVSAVLAVAKAATLAIGHDFVGAEKSLARASRLRPGDANLAGMSQVLTRFSRGATPVDQRPGTIKRPKVGNTLDGWRLEKLLGFGGWGQVFLARKGDQVRALKIMNAELSQDAEFVKRFKREMITLHGLGAHPHLVHIDSEHIFDKADDWNCWYYVMEFVDGVTFEEYLKTNGPLTLGQAHAIFDGIADGLRVAHERGVIHRDIKPDNILIRRQSEAGKGRGILVDFGLAGRVDANTGGAGFTAFFAAPEQMRQAVSDCRSDVYSLAATIYYGLFYKDVDKRGRFKAKLLPADIPSDVRELLERCLDNDPGERPADAGKFVQEWCKVITTPIGKPPAKELVPEPKESAENERPKKTKKPEPEREEAFEEERPKEKKKKIDMEPKVPPDDNAAEEGPWTVLFVTKPENNPERLENAEEPIWWSCQKDMREGDTILLYITGEGIRYQWRAASDAEPEATWGYRCDVVYEATFDPAIHIREIKSVISKGEWGAPYGNFQGRTFRVPDAVVAKLLALRK